MTKILDARRAVNWNRIEDQVDLNVWNRANTNFWLPEKITISNDIPSFQTLSTDERLVLTRVFTGLTLLDTIQGLEGAPTMAADAITSHEPHVFNQFALMESIHARSYSSIFMTLCPTVEVDDAYTWSENNPYLQEKARLVREMYLGDCPLRRKITAVFLESFLFYSGFFYPLYLNSRKKVMNVGDLIRLIIRDEAVHGWYVGYKYQRNIETLSESKKAELQDWAYNMLYRLYENEIKYTEDIYDRIGMTEQVKHFLHHNANIALSNLGYPALFPDSITDVNPTILASLYPVSDENHDFFSKAGSAYLMLPSVMSLDEDWDFSKLTETL